MAGDIRFAAAPDRWLGLSNRAVMLEIVSHRPDHDPHGIP
jgi:hypothetical protein